MKWSVKLSQMLPDNTAIEKSPIPFYLTEPVVAAHNVIIGASILNNGYVIAIDAATGNRRWVYQNSSDRIDNKIMSSAISWHNSIIIRQAAKLVALDVKDGTTMWTAQFGESRVPANCYTNHPAVCDNNAYFNSDFGVSYSVDLKTGMQNWRQVTEGISIFNNPVLHRINVSLSSCAPTYVASKSGDVLLIKRQRLVNGGIWHCVLSQKNAFLTFNPLKTKGWEVFDLTHWKTVWRENSFKPLTCPVVASNCVVLYGGNFASEGKAEKREIRTYRTRSHSKL